MGECAYAKLVIAEQIVEKATKEAYVQAGSVPPLALVTPVAIVATYVCAKVPDMTELLTAECHALCPYTVPMYVPRTSDLSDAQYKLKIGYVISSSVEAVCALAPTATPKMSRLCSPSSTSEVTPRYCRLSSSFAS